MMARCWVFGAVNLLGVSGAERVPACLPCGGGMGGVVTHAAVAGHMVVSRQDHGGPVSGWMAPDVKHEAWPQEFPIYQWAQSVGA